MSDGASAEPISAALEAQLAAVTEERDEYRKLVLHLREEIERLKRGLLGQKAERLPANDAQLSLMMLGLALGDGPATEPVASPPVEETVAAHTRRKARAQAAAGGPAAGADRDRPARGRARARMPSS